MSKNKPEHILVQLMCQSVQQAALHAARCAQQRLAPRPPGCQQTPAQRKAAGRAGEAGES